MKRSVNFTGRKPMKASHVLDLMKWVGMSDEEIRAALEQKKPTTPTLDPIAQEIIEQRRDRQMLAPVRGQLADWEDEDF